MSFAFYALYKGEDLNDQKGKTMSKKTNHEDSINQTGESLEEQVEHELDEAGSQAKEQFDRILRLQADIENMKRRAEKDVASAHKYAVEKLLKELLPIMDSLEMALKSSENADSKTLIEGVELTHKMFIDTLQKHGVESIDPEGGVFDPEKHQAVSMQVNPNLEPNSVLNVMQKGYSLNGRLVRPAMVVVSQ